MAVKKTELIDCTLFIETDTGIFDMYETKLEINEELPTSNYVYNILSQSKAHSITFQHRNGVLPVRGEFICIPHDAERRKTLSYAYESKRFSREMEIEILYENEYFENLIIAGSYRESDVNKRLVEAIENNVTIPIYHIRTAQIPLKKTVFIWKPEYREHTLIARLWNNKVIKLKEIGKQQG
jgi:hypothetical protein